MFCVYPPHNLLSYRISFLRISLSLPFCVLFIGRVHGLPLWRAIDLKCCLSVCFLFLSLVWDGSTSFRYQMVFTILLEIIQDTYTNVYVQDTYTNVYRTHMHMHAYMHTYIHTLVGSGSLFPQSVLQCLCSCVVFRILYHCHLCVCGVECNRDHHSEFFPQVAAPPPSCQRELTLNTKSRQREEASEGLKHGSQTNIPNFG
jgi:hypothetical protein